MKKIFMNTIKKGTIILSISLLVAMIGLLLGSPGSRTNENILETDQMSELEKEGRVKLASNATESIPYEEPSYRSIQYSYTGNNDGERTITITGLIPSRNTSCHNGWGSEYTDNGSPAIEIPSTYAGYTVTRIGSSIASHYSPQLYSDGCRHYNIISPSVIKLPKTLLRIEANAFSQGITTFWAWNANRTYSAFEYTKFDLSLCSNLQ